MRAPDIKTKRYLSRLAGEIGYIHRDVTSRPTEEVFAELGIPLQYIISLEVRDGTLATVYSFDRNRASDVSTAIGERDLGCEETELFAYAVDYPERRDGKYVHFTYIFNTQPAVDDIRSAHDISGFKRDYEYGDCDSWFICRCCDRRVHWTDTVRSSSDTDLTIQERLFLLKTEVCTLDVVMAERNSGKIEGPSQFFKNSASKRPSGPPSITAGENVPSERSN